jgi:hypothetical protein
MSLAVIASTHLHLSGANILFALLGAVVVYGEVLSCGAVRRVLAKAHRRCGKDPPGRQRPECVLSVQPNQPIAVMTMETITGISVDAGASISDDCPVTYSVDANRVEIDFGTTTADSLHLGLTHKALIRLIDVANNALAESRRVREGARATTSPDRPRETV